MSITTLPTAPAEATITLLATFLMTYSPHGGYLQFDDDGDVALVERLIVDGVEEVRERPDPRHCHSRAILLGAHDAGQLQNYVCHSY